MGNADDPAGRRGVFNGYGPANGRLLLIVLLGCTAVSSTVGCARGPRASMASFVDRTPWGKPTVDVTAETTEAPEAVAAGPEAVVVANVSKPTETDTKSGELGVSSAESAPGRSQLGGRQSRLPEGWSQPVAGANDDLIVPRNSDSPAAVVAAAHQPPESEQRIQDLKAALTADAEREAAEREQANAAHPLRVRAESLITRAKDLLRLGELNEARRAAEQAVQLSESGQLAFLPTEDRPHDVLNQVQAAITRRDTTTTSTEAGIVGLDIDAASGPALEAPVLAGAGDVLPSTETALLPPELAPPADPLFQVVANRPVSRATLREPEAASAASSVELLPSLGEVPEWTPEVVASLPPARELPPFRGNESSWTEQARDVPGWSPDKAPAPPDVEQLQPLPSVRVDEVSSDQIALAGPPLRPLFSLESLIWAVTVLGVICCIAGCGLTVRRLLERR